MPPQSDADITSVWHQHTRGHCMEWLLFGGGVSPNGHLVSGGEPHCKSGFSLSPSRGLGTLVLDPARLSGPPWPLAGDGGVELLDSGWETTGDSSRYDGYFSIFNARIEVTMKLYCLPGWALMLMTLLSQVAWMPGESRHLEAMRWMSTGLGMPGFPGLSFLHGTITIEQGEYGWAAGTKCMHLNVSACSAGEWPLYKAHLIVPKEDLPY